MLTTVRIIGHSMAPYLLDNDSWVVWRTQRVRPGDVVMLTHPVRSNFLIVKRAISQREDGDWWVEGDNRDYSDDSRSFGFVGGASILGRLVLRYSPIVRRSTM